MSATVLSAVAIIVIVTLFLVILPPFALILLGCVIWVHRAIYKDLQEK